MKRLSTIFAALPLALLAVAPVSAQEETQPAAHVYEAYYDVGYGDLDEWNRQWNEYSVPILDALVEEGVIEGWSHWQHNVGGTYNVRFTARTHDWASIETFWSQYLERYFASTPEAEAELAG